MLKRDRKTLGHVLKSYNLAIYFEVICDVLERANCPTTYLINN